MNSVDCSRRALVGLGIAGLLVAPLARAAEQQRYAVLSLIGDRADVVWWQPGVGSHIDKNARAPVIFKDGALDKIALLAVDDALRRARPGSAAALLAVRDPQLYALQDRMMDAGGDGDELLTALKGLLAQTQATRLILVTKYRNDARFQMQDNTVGTGKVAGLGFYVDQEMSVTDLSTGIRNDGFIAPFAYVTLSLIDATTMKPIRRVNVPESFVVPTAVSASAIRPWDAMTAQAKAEAISQLINKAATRGVADLLRAE